MLFHSWDGLLRILVVGVMAYPALIAVLRLSGKRTLSKLNAFDFIVTIALGSVFATMLLSKTVPLIEGMAALGLLVLLQFIVAKIALRFPLAERLVKSSPRVLLSKGEMNWETLRSERITEEEILAAVRGAGHGGISGIAAVVLETDGSLSVIAVDWLGDGSAIPSQAVKS